MASDRIQGSQGITDVTNARKWGQAIQHRAGPRSTQQPDKQDPGLNNTSVAKSSHISPTGFCLLNAINFQIWEYTSKKQIFLTFS